MHLIDLVLRFCLRFIQVGKNGQLTALLFCGELQPAVIAVIIKNQMELIRIAGPKKDVLWK